MRIAEDVGKQELHVITHLRLAVEAASRIVEIHMTLLV
jgi:hypothetical protein